VNDTAYKVRYFSSPQQRICRAVVRTAAKEREEVCFAQHARVTSLRDYISAPTRRTTDVPGVTRTCLATGTRL